MPSVRRPPVHPKILLPRHEHKSLTAFDPIKVSCKKHISIQNQNLIKNMRSIAVSNIELNEIVTAKDPISKCIFKCVDAIQDFLTNPQLSNFQKKNIQSAFNLATKILPEVFNRKNNIYYFNNKTSASEIGLKIVKAFIFFANHSTNPLVNFNHYLKESFPFFLTEKSTTKKTLSEKSQMHINKNHIFDFLETFFELKETLKLPTLHELDLNLRNISSNCEISKIPEVVKDVFNTHYFESYATVLTNQYLKIFLSSHKNDNDIFKFLNILLYLENARQLGVRVDQPNSVPDVPLVFVPKDGDIYNNLCGSTAINQPGFKLNAPTHILISAHANYEKEIKDVFKYLIENPNSKIIYMSPYISFIKKDLNFYKSLYSAVLPEIKNAVENMKDINSSLLDIRTRLTLTTHIDQVITQKLLKESTMFIPRAGNSLPIAEVVSPTQEQALGSAMMHVLRQGGEINISLRSSAQQSTYSSAMSSISTTSNLGSTHSISQHTSNLNPVSSIDKEIIDTMQSIIIHDQLMRDFESTLTHPNLTTFEIKAVQKLVNYNFQEKSKFSRKLNVLRRNNHINSNYLSHLQSNLTREFH
ncbi:MAG: hypothetical protein V4629_10200 [Pseudomonadota bacterium]